MINHNIQKEYPKSIRDFAVRLYIRSPSAYNFVRESFNKNLPHKSTIQNWQQKIDGSPGFNKAIIPAIKSKILEASENGKKLKFSLQLDGMYIHSTLEGRSNGRVYGYEDLGTGGLETDQNNEEPKVAKEALVFLVNAINDRFKAPVAYFLINGIKSQELAYLVDDVLFFLESNGIDVISITFDGHRSNLSMCKVLGASLNAQKLQPSFESPHGNTIHILFDAAHMIKVIRNQLWQKQIIYDGNDKPIHWIHLKQLNKIQEKEGLRLANKVTRRHIDFHNEKMKVKLATQLFSKSVADAILFLKSSNVSGFDDCDSTAKFIEIINNMFDIFNSYSLYNAYKFKRAISEKNCDEIFAYLDMGVEYIKQLYYLGPNKEKVIPDIFIKQNNFGHSKKLERSILT